MKKKTEIERFSSKQLQALKQLNTSPHIEYCEEGGARSGKTYLIIRNMINNSLLYPYSRHLIARFRFNHLVTTVWRQTLVPMLESVCKGYYKVDSEYYTIFFKNGSEIVGAGLDDQERVEKLMGSEYSTIFINESTQISFDTYQKIKTRLSLRAYNKEGKELKRYIVVDCNPRNEFHWIYKYFILNKDPKSESFLQDGLRSKISHRKWFPWDNPFLPQDYLDMLKNLTGAERQRLYEAQWVSNEGLVYPDFEKCIVDGFTIPENWQVFGAVDFGYTNPFAFLWIAYDQSNETYFVFDELYESNKTIFEHCQEIKTRRKVTDWIVADHDAGDRAIMEDQGLVTIKANKDVQAGIQAVKKYIYSEKGEKIRIFRSCLNLIEEGNLYQWDKSKEGKNEKEIPVKYKDHALDCLRYFSIELESGKIGFTKNNTINKSNLDGYTIQRLRHERMGIKRQGYGR